MNKPAPRPLLPLDEVLARLVEGSRPARIGQTESVSTFDALGRVLAADVLSGLDVPPQDNTAMDGYALRTADVPAAGTVLPVAQRIPAGVVGATLAAGTAARVFTGAQIPAGADAVLPQEQADSMPSAAGDAGFGSVRVQAVPQAGDWIRRRGEDVRRGDAVLRRGARLNPQSLGLAASVGAGTLEVVRKPRVAIFSTGDELRMPGEPLPPGAIYNSNRFTLRALLQASGCEVADLGIVPDRLDATRAALREAAASNDLIVTCGGVSVGEEDHLKPAVEAEGRLEHWQIAMKPGKPLAFEPCDAARGELKSEALFVGLPGNPVSAFITHLLCVNTVLAALQGAATGLPRAIPMRAGFDWPRPDKRREFLRARIGDGGDLELFGNQSSGVLTSAVWADGLIDNPPSMAIARGDTVQFLPLSQLVAR